MDRYKYSIMRRLSQSAIMLLFLGGNIYGWSFLHGNLSSARLMDAVPMSDPFAVIQTIAAGAIPKTEAVTGALIIALTYAVIGGRFFCGWVCPLNIITDAAGKLRGVTGIDNTSDRMDSWRNARYWIIGITIAISAVLGTAAFERISPIAALHRMVIFGSIGGWFLVAAVFLFDLFGMKNGFCGRLCPLGGFYSLIGRFGILRIGYEKDRCSMCLRCKDICPEPQVLDLVGAHSGAVRSGNCINCGRCIEVCNDRALAFRNIYKIKN